MMGNPDPMHANHLAILAESLNSDANTTCNAITSVIDDIIACVMPRNALSHAKRYLQRHFHKPAIMSIFSYCQHLVYINTQELPMIPPFGINQSCVDDEIVDVMLFTIPPEWLCEMDRMGFDSHSK
jgi:hypothetical protein